MENTVLTFICYILLTVSYLSGTSASGRFELQVLSLHNLKGELGDGACCRGTGRDGQGACLLPCRTYIRVCLREYQTRLRNLSATNGCAFGNVTSKVLGGNVIKEQDTAEDPHVLDMPFSFAWTVSSFLYIFLSYH